MVSSKINKVHWGQVNLDHLLADQPKLCSVLKIPASGNALGVINTQYYLAIVTTKMHWYCTSGQ